MLSGNSLFDTPTLQRCTVSTILRASSTCKSWPAPQAMICACTTVSASIRSPSRSSTLCRAGSSGNRGGERYPSAPMPSALLADPPPRLLDDPRGGERLDVRRGTPVQDGQFLSAHLDAQVAHAHAGRGGEQMLHRAHRCALPQSDTALRVAHHAGGRFDRGGGGTVHAHKHDARAERGRLAHHPPGISAVDAHAPA